MQSQQQSTFFRQPSSSYFSLESFKPAPRLPQHRRPGGGQQDSFFKTGATPSPAPRHKEAELHEAGPAHQALQQGGADRLSALHSRLQQEAEKIRKWKNATEVEIKHKDKQLQDSQKTIESQRKTVTELQIQSETLGSRLRDEVANQKEIERKIEATRDLCNALKDHVLRVEDTVTKGELDRNEVVQLNQLRLQQFQGLVGQFQRLEVETAERESKLTDAITAERNHSESVTQQCEQLQQQLSEAHTQLGSLQSHSAEQEAALTQQQVATAELQTAVAEQRAAAARLSAEVEGKARQCADLEAVNGQLSRELQSCQSRLEERVGRVGELEGEVEVCRKELQEGAGLVGQLRQQLQEMEVFLAKSQDRLQRLLSLLQASHHQRCCDYEAQLSSEKGRGSSLEQTLVGLEAQLANERGRSSLLEQKGVGLEAQLADEKEQNSSLEQKGAELLAHLSKERERNSVLEKQQAELESELSAEKGRGSFLEQKRAELEAALEEAHRGAREEREGLERKSREETERLEREAREEREGLERVLREGQERLQQTQTLLHQKSCQLESEQQRAEQWAGQCRALEEGRGELEGTLRSQLEQLQQQLELERVEHEASMVQLQETVSKETSRLSKEQEEWSKVELSLNQRCQDLEKQLSEECGRREGAEEGRGRLEGEVEGLRGENSALASQLREKTEHAGELDKEVRRTVDKELSKVRGQMSLRSDELGALMEKYRGDAEQARMELQDAKKSFDTQVDEMCAMLEKYRAGNQKIVSQKEREVEALGERLKESEQNKESWEGELGSLRGQVTSLEAELRAREEELKELLKAIDALQSKPSCIVPATPRKTPSSLLPPSSPTNPLKPSHTPTASTPSTAPSSPCTSKNQGESPVPSTPKCPSPSRRVASTPRLRPPKTPKERVYNYRVCSTPRNKPRPLASPLHSTPRAKKFCQGGSVAGGEADSGRGELAQFHELYPSSTVEEEEEVVFKKPKAKVTSTVSRAAVSSSSDGGAHKGLGRKPLASCNKITSGHGGRRRGQAGKKGGRKGEDFSWFELDSVFGFGPDD